MDKTSGMRGGLMVFSTIKVMVENYKINYSTHLNETTSVDLHINEFVISYN